MVPGEGEGDADSVEAAEEGMCGDWGVLFPAVVFPDYLNSEVAPAPAPDPSQPMWVCGS